MVDIEKPFFDIIEQLNLKSKEEFKKLLVLKERFPFFQTTWLYLAKWSEIHKQKDVEQLLHQTSARTYDRSLLFDWKNKQIKMNDKVTHITEKNKPLKKVVKKTQKKKTSTNEKKSKVKAEKSLPPQMTFTDWIQFLETKKSDQSKSSSLIERFALVDAFLAQQPKINLKKETVSKNEDLSESSWTSTEELITETLAKVFVKQKKYDRAIKAYEILRLKYPEKNSFFANQIKVIKDLQKLK